jgi:hypothetical protein
LNNVFGFYEWPIRQAAPHNMTHIPILCLLFGGQLPVDVKQQLKQKLMLKFSKTHPDVQQTIPLSEDSAEACPPCFDFSLRTSFVVTIKLEVA